MNTRSPPDICICRLRFSFRYFHPLSCLSTIIQLTSTFYRSMLEGRTDLDAMQMCLQSVLRYNTLANLIFWWTWHGVVVGFI
ncbi:hypothetical protein F0562_027969 [Nyssa sinensis]|uniref:Uncharacterized protein n=1 Tax=Nyssa sinensis TaxID=561372 RepID=A0A5J5B6G0_9ASTE|nr:hypothetical protein F0562_027969 [Nyssa sinensis]